jgi:hypothetical protein
MIRLNITVQTTHLTLQRPDLYFSSGLHWMVKQIAFLYIYKLVAITSNATKFLRNMESIGAKTKLVQVASPLRSAQPNLHLRFCLLHHDVLEPRENRKFSL